MAKPKLNQHFLEFSKCLAEHKVRYLLIGDYAVGFHGWAWNTHDIDFWVAGDADNQARLVQALRDFAFPEAGDNLLVEPDAIVRFGPAPYRVEIIRRISGIEFEDAWPNRAEWSQGEIHIPVIGLGDLRKNKAASGRTQDQADLEHLPEK